MAARELVALLALFFAYKLGRTLTLLGEDTAFANADRVWELERALGLPSELAVQQAMLDHPQLIEAINRYYMFVHLPAMAACLAFVYARRPDIYPRLRAGLFGMTGLALVLHLTFPLAPPRMLEHLGFVDTGAVYGPSVYGPPEETGLLNQYAAMPSLHVGWAVLVAAALVAASSGPWRWLWVAHPAITTIAVVSSANHYWLDGLVAVGLLGITLAVCAAHARRQAGARSSSSAVDRSGSTPSSRDSTISQRR
jgi:hypothetical protein